MSFLRHREIFPSDGGASPAANAPAHRLDEFPAGYSSAGCSPAEPASASPAGHQYAVCSSCRSRIFHPTANSVLTVCLSPGGQRTGAQSTFTYTLQYQLLVDSVPDGAGQVARTSDYSSPNGTVNLTAIPNPGYSFVNWTGAAVADATAASTTITMSNEFNLTANFALTTPMPPPSNISAQVQTATSNPSFANQHLVESVTITNTGGQYISGPLSVVLTNLTNGFTLANATGVFNGSPIRVYDFGVLNPGQSYVVYLEFNVGPAAIVRYTPSVYSGL